MESSIETGGMLGSGSGRRRGAGAGGARSHQLGLYRGEEFLRLSRRRQVRRGAACAASAAALAALLVLVIIVIYDYWTAAQTTHARSRGGNAWNETSQRGAAPAARADKLGRTRPPLEQESFARMPLLINALQEDSYLDSAFEVRAHSGAGRALHALTGRLRYTSPRPFTFEYRGPTPEPFRRSALSSRDWLDRYRSSQRLKNLEHVIQYLQKTVRAKVADLAPSSTDRLVTFAGAYLHPQRPAHAPFRPPAATSVDGRAYESDVLYAYKPAHPGEVNLLADELLRFSPIPTPPPPLFRRNKYLPRNTCYGIKCPPRRSLDRLIDNASAEQTEGERTQLLGLTLDVFPIDADPEAPFSFDSNRRNLARLAPAPRPGFRPKVTPKLSGGVAPVHLIAHPRPKSHVSYEPKSRMKNFIWPRLYSGRARVAYTTSEETQIFDSSESTTKTVSLGVDATKDVSVNAASSNVEDISMTTIDRETVTPPAAAFSPPAAAFSPPPVLSSPYAPFLFTDSYTISEGDSTVGGAGVAPARTPSRPEIFKFNAEDAKFPDEYRAVARREPSTVEGRSVEAARSETTAPRSIVVKLRNEDIVSSTRAPSTSVSLKSESATWTPSSTTEVFRPQINGHYRSLSRHSQHINVKVTGSGPAASPSASASTAAPPRALPVAVAAVPARHAYVVLDRSSTAASTTSTSTAAQLVLRNEDRSG